MRFDRVLEKAQEESNMKYVRSILSVVALMSLSTVVFAQSDAQKAPSDLQKAYDKLKTLAGSMARPSDNPPAATRDGGRSAYGYLSAHHFAGKRHGA